MCAGRKACTDFAAGDEWTPVDPIEGLIAVNIGEWWLPAAGMMPPSRLSCPKWQPCSLQECFPLAGMALCRSLLDQAFSF